MADSYHGTNADVTTTLQRNKVAKQPTHRCSHPDPRGGGIVIPEDMESSKPNIFPTASRSFLDSLPDERNVYVYDGKKELLNPKLFPVTQEAEWLK